ncbi:MAG: helix-turn-helix transcriptional regulator [Devosia sp.]
MPTTYLTRTQVAERYPISAHTLAKLAATGKGPRFYKPTDKCLYRPEDIEAWIEASVVLPKTEPVALARPVDQPRSSGSRGRARPPVAHSTGRRLKSLPPSRQDLSLAPHPLSWSRTMGPRSGSVRAKGDRHPGNGSAEQRPTSRDRRGGFACLA